MFWERVASPECKTEQKWIWHSYIMSNQSAEAKGMIEFQTFPLLFLQGKAGGGEHFNKWACWHFLSWKIIFPLEKSFVREVSEFLQPAAFFFLKRLGVLWTGYWKGHLHHRTCVWDIGTMEEGSCRSHVVIFLEETPPMTSPQACLWDHINNLLWIPMNPKY